MGTPQFPSPLGGGRTRRTPRAPLFPGSGARAHTQRRCPLTPRTAHHTPLVAVLQSAARARCTGPTCGRRYERRGSTRGSAPTTSNAPPWHRGADDQAQRMTPGKRSRASTTAAGRRAAPNHGGRAAAARTLRHNANRARPSTGKHTPRLGHTVPRARERGWLLAREESFRDPLQDHARIIPRKKKERKQTRQTRDGTRTGSPPARAGFWKDDQGDRWGSPAPDKGHDRLAARCAVDSHIHWRSHLSLATCLQLVAGSLSLPQAH